MEPVKSETPSTETAAEKPAVTKIVKATTPKPKVVKPTVAKTAKTETAPVAKTVEKPTEEAPKIEMSASFEKNLDNIRSGKKMHIKGEDGYFIHNNGRLEQRADNGDYMDSAPLPNFQEKAGWSVAE